MAKRINKPEQLPEWFNLERYEALLSLSVAEFIDQLTERLSLMTMPAHGVDDDGELKAANGPILNTGFHVINNRTKKTGTLEGKGSICPLIYSTLAHMDERARTKGAYGDGAKGGRVMAMPGELAFNINLDAWDHAVPMPDGPTVTINLADYTDEEILTDLAQLIPAWRESLNHPEPRRITDRAGIANLRKAIEYQAIPLLDLLLWELEKGFYITNDLLAATLYPDFSVSGAQVGETRKPFIKELEKDETFNRMMLALDKEPHIYDWTVSDFMKWQA